MRTRVRPAVLAGVALAIVLVGAASTSPARLGAQPVGALRDYRWKRRVLVVLAPADGAGSDSMYRAQQREVTRNAAALAERDVTVLDLPADSAAARARTLRQQLGVPGAGFAVVLVGKDGGVKLRRRTVLPADRLLATIDGMPMGASERRRRHPERR